MTTRREQWIEEQVAQHVTTGHEHIRQLLRDAMAVADATPPQDGVRYHVKADAEGNGFIVVDSQTQPSEGDRGGLVLADFYERPHAEMFAQQMNAPAAPVPQGEVLAKHQPCGCVVCTCEDEVRCHGCGAKHCGTHPVGQIPNKVYIQSTPTPDRVREDDEDRLGAPEDYPHERDKM